jgi:hypothetical protein
MGSPKPARGADSANVAKTAADLAVLGSLTVAGLARKYEELFGAPSRSRNKEYLRKRLAFRIQELAEGGLSPRALARIEELNRNAPPLGPRTGAKTARAPEPAKEESGVVRDPRLPASGTVLTRTYGKAEHRVTVLDDGFEYKGKPYPSLSRIAREITGTSWNGFLFFLGRKGSSRKPNEAPKA